MFQGLTPKKANFVKKRPIELGVINLDILNANIFGRQVEAHKMFCIKGMFHKKISQKVWMKAVLPDEITFYIKQKVQKELNARGKSSGSS